MCGIVGLFTNQRPILSEDERSIKRVVDRLSYRGPDGTGMWKSEKILLGHRRLSIVDLSEAGAQPFEISQLGLVITFNGEIYNYKELRALLVSQGYTFRSHSDTEVILYAYYHYGMDFIQHLRGMFAFCLIDRKKSTAILARDPAGEKPLYYYQDSRKLIFSSEIKAFHAFSDVNLSLDAQSVKAFFALQYIPGPHTVYRQVKRLQPGSILEINLDRWTIREDQYWSIINAGAETPSQEAMEQLLLESIRYRLVADVEVGLLLSGGIDSSLIASFAHKSGAKLRAFTARFDDEKFDESAYANQVAGGLGLEQVFISGGRLTPELFDKVIFHGDELLGDPACIPTFLLSQEISNHVKVVLSGEGADELFWGYDTYRFEKAWRWLRWINSLVSRSTSFQSKISSMETSNRVPMLLTRLGKVISSTYNIGASRWTSVFGDHTLNRLIPHSNDNDHITYLDEMERHLKSLEKYFEPFDASLSMDLLYWLPDDLLMKVDRMTMAHGVEARAPFLDSELILKAIYLPSGEKIHSKSGKYILRKLVEKHFPGKVGKSLAWRRKHGFEVPVNFWLRNILRDCTEDRLSPHKLAKSGLIEVSFVRNLKKNFYSSSADTSLRRKLWLILCYQSWFEMHEKGFGFRQE